MKVEKVERHKKSSYKTSYINKVREYNYVNTQYMNEC